MPTTHADPEHAAPGEAAGRPAHHRAGGGFRNPWPTDEAHGFGDFLRWTFDRMTTKGEAPGISREEFARRFPPATPSPALPRASTDRLLATWVGHSTFLLQIGGMNVLTDPVWGERASPVPFAGPRRWTPPGVAFDTLPPIDLVLVSHDHYDHLDEPTVRRLVRRHPDAQWLAPLGVARWLRRRGVTRVGECDWWDAVRLPLPAAPAAASHVASVGAAGVETVVTCVPAQHFSGRRANNRNETLWCGWTVRAGARSAYYVGDTGYFPSVGEAAARGGGPFDLVLMPVGAYQPRWFMRPVHNDPDDAVRAYRELVAVSPRENDAGATRAARRTPVMAGMHWGAFKLTDEPMDEPPRRTREAWQAAGLAPELLWLPAHGETREI